MIDPVWKNDSKNWTLFVFNNDSKDWTLCKWLIQLSLFYEPLLNKSWTFVFIWLKELNLLSILLKRFWVLFKDLNSFWIRLKNWNLWLKNSQKIELFPKNYDSKNWTFFFSDLTQRNEIWKNDSKSWTVFLNMTYRIEPLLFSLIWFIVLNLVSKKETQKIEIFF